SKRSISDARVLAVDRAVVLLRVRGNRHLLSRRRIFDWRKLQQGDRGNCSERGAGTRGGGEDRIWRDRRPDRRQEGARARIDDGGGRDTAALGCASTR